MNNAQKLLWKITAGATAAALTFPSFADGFDVADVLTTLGLVAAAVGSVGVIVLGIVASIAGYRFIRRAF
ncbi:phage coat protein [Aeromonas caviae]|uniref:major capsid protein n=1 Tax=Aeromonas caviae TaxID=648 RepID=UPI00191CCE90|nr:major capsid protein [Aeromonas caviae]MBL0654914.1 phage coat protein [Aeromonas caviae]MBL0656354.1 phage coat protein [Aeromonas caviae]